MTRGRIDAVPQRVLALRLRHAVDRRNLEEATSLIEQNPHSGRSAHVRHNLGKQRIAWLAERGVRLED